MKDESQGILFLILKDFNPSIFILYPSSFIL